MSEAAKWYVVHTYSGYENKVASTLLKTVENRHLEDQIFDVRVPTETVTELRDTGAKEVERKIFPGYVLIKIIDGPLEGFIGKVDEIDLPGQTVKVTVSMFGRATPAELKFGQVAALETLEK